MSAIVQQLIDQGLVREIGLARSTGGRQPTLLELNPLGLHAAGVEISDTGINAVLVGFTGTVLQKTHLTLRDARVDAVVDCIEHAVETICGKASLSRESLAGLGVAVPGIIGKEEGRILFSRSMGWENVELKRILKDRFGLDTYVMNNAVAGALAADYEFNKKETRALLFFLVCLKNTTHNRSTTLGSGIVLDGRAYLGDGHMAGEIRVDIPHPMFLAKTDTENETPADLQDLIRKSLAEPAEYRSLWNVFAELLGSVIARGIDFINPGKVIIGTDIPELEGLIGFSLRGIVHTNTVEEIVSRVCATETLSPLPVDFVVVETETLAKGSIVPHLQQLSLAPLLRRGVLL